MENEDAPPSDMAPPAMASQGLSPLHESNEDGHQPPPPPSDVEITPPSGSTRTEPTIESVREDVDVDENEENVPPMEETST